MMSTKEEGLLPDRDLPLPSLEELIPLGISLISPELARAFSICQDISPNKSPGDESQRALGINGVASNLSVSGSNALDLDVRKSPWKQQEAEMADMEESDSAMGGENSGEEPTARTLKRPRLVWTPQLHKRFVDAVAHLGIKNAVPKTIMQLMNVEGLTRENVASHLQKYRLYLKRMQGLSSEGPSSSDHLFASTPVPPGLAGAAHFLPGHRDDVVTALSFSSPLVPMSMPGLGGGHIGSLGGQRPYGLEHHPFAALGKMPSQRIVYGDPRDMVVENQSQSISSPRCALTLFPTSNN